MAYCKNCGNELNGAKFCTKCGTAADSEPVASENPEVAPEVAADVPEAPEAAPEVAAAESEIPEVAPEIPAGVDYSGIPAEKKQKAGAIGIIIALIVVALIGTCVYFAFTGFGDNDDKSEKNASDKADDENSKKKGYKDVTKEFAEDFKELDAKKIVGLMPDELAEMRADKKGMSKKEFIKDGQTRFDEMEEEFTDNGYKWKKLKYEIGDYEDLDDDELEKMNGELADKDIDLEIKEAKKVDITFTIPADDKDEDDEEVSLPIMVGKIDKSWYLLDMKL